MKWILLALALITIQRQSLVSGLYLTRCLYNEDGIIGESSSVLVELQCSSTEKLAVTLVAFGRTMTPILNFCEAPSTHWLHYRFADADATVTLKNECDGRSTCARTLFYDADKYEDLWSTDLTLIYVTVEYQCIEDSDDDFGWRPEIRNPMRHTPFEYEGPSLILLSEGYPRMTEHFTDFNCAVTYQSMQFQVLDMKHDDSDESPFCIVWRGLKHCATAGILLVNDFALARSERTVHLNFTATQGATSDGRFWMTMTALRSFWSSSEEEDVHIRVSCTRASGGGAGSNPTPSLQFTTPTTTDDLNAIAYISGARPDLVLYLVIALCFGVAVVAAFVVVCIIRRSRRFGSGSRRQGVEPAVVADRIPHQPHDRRRPPPSSHKSTEKHLSTKRKDEELADVRSLPPTYSEAAGAPPSYSEIDYSRYQPPSYRSDAGVIVDVRQLETGFDNPAAISDDGASGGKNRMSPSDW